MAERGGPFRTYCRVAGAAFVFVVVYTLLAKLPAGEFGGDWMHTVLHVATGAAAVYAGWFAARGVAAKAFTLALGAAYGVLGVGGWFGDGFLMDSTFRIPLGPQDNIFHLVLAVGAALTMVASRGSPAEYASRRKLSSLTGNPPGGTAVPLGDTRGRRTS